MFAGCCFYFLLMWPSDYTQRFYCPRTVHVELMLAVVPRVTTRVIATLTNSILLESHCGMCNILLILYSIKKESVCSFVCLRVILIGHCL